MSRTFILLIVLVVHAAGCSEQSGPQEPPPQVAQQNGSSEPSTLGDELPETAPTEIPAADVEEPPRDAMALYRQSQALIKEGKLEAGYESAKKAMQQFVAEDVDLAWMMLESIQAGDKRVDVHFNMGEREREMPNDGIVRPLSFRVWSGGDPPDLLQVIDFEIGRSNGESITAAIGEMTESGHSNYGILDVDASYKVIRQRVVELLTQE